MVESIVDTSDMLSDGVPVTNREGVQVLYKGKPLKLKRLALYDVIPLGRILENVLVEGGNEVIVRLHTIDWKNPLAVQNTWAVFVLAGMTSPSSSGAIFSFLGNLLDVPAIEFENANIFPLSTMPAIVYSLTRHPDLTDFFPEIRALIMDRISPETKDKMNKFMTMLLKIS